MSGWYWGQDFLEVKDVEYEETIKTRVKRLQMSEPTKMCSFNLCVLFELGKHAKAFRNKPLPKIIQIAKA